MPWLQYVSPQGSFLPAAPILSAGAETPPASHGEGVSPAVGRLLREKGCCEGPEAPEQQKAVLVLSVRSPSSPNLSSVNNVTDIHKNTKHNVHKPLFLSYKVYPLVNKCTHVFMSSTSTDWAPPGCQISAKGWLHSREQEKHKSFSRKALIWVTETIHQSVHESAVVEKRRHGNDGESVSPLE